MDKSEILRSHFEDEDDYAKEIMACHVLCANINTLWLGNNAVRFLSSLVQLLFFFVMCILFG